MGIIENGILPKNVCLLKYVFGFILNVADNNGLIWKCGPHEYNIVTGNNGYWVFQYIRLTFHMAVFNENTLPLPQSVGYMTDNEYVF